MTEVCAVVDVSQFQSGHSTDKCGFYAVSLLKFAGRVDHGVPSGNASQVSGWADSTYIRYDGPDIFSNQNGMTVPMLYQVLSDAGLHYQGIGARETAFQVGNLTADYVRAWVRAGYPVVLSVAENNVWDCDLGCKPYAWDTTGFFHVILCTGVAGDGNLLCHDTANIGPQGVRSGPRRYDAGRLQQGLTSATAVVLPWMTRPGQGFDPTKTQGGHTDMAVTMNDATMQQWFIQSGDHIIRKDKPEIFMFGANAAFYMQLGGVAVCGLPTSCEYRPNPQEDVAILPCERLRIVYDPARKRDNPPIPGQCYLEHIDTQQAQQPALQAQIDKLTGKITQIFALCQAD